MAVHALQESKLKVFRIQRTCVHDGPGMRTTIFFQGCGLRCAWCQNPEMLSFRSGVAPDHEYSVDDILEVVARDKPYYCASDGGVTLSGGEPLQQNPGSLAELLQALKREKIHVVVETSLHAPWRTIAQVAPCVDLFLVDLKVVGDDALHARYTGHDSALIRDNLRKLLELGARVRFRMMIAPGFNDGEDHLQALARFLDSVNHRSIELLQYHSLYEDKARSLGLNFTPLHITAEAGQNALRSAAATLRQLGIQAQCLDLDAARRPATFTPRVKAIQHDIRESGRALCLEACLLKSEYYRKHGFSGPTPIHRARCLAYVLGRKRVIVYPGELLVGNFTAKRVAGQLWAEYYGIVGVKMLHKLQRLKPVRFQASLRERLAFLRTVPFWRKNSLFGRVYPNVSGYVEVLARASVMNAGFNNNLAAIAHFIVNFDRVLTLGTSGLIEEIRSRQREKPENNQDFYTGAIIALEGLEAFAQRYADHLECLSESETDPERRRELSEMTHICRQVPKYPARTFHEALQSMTFLHIALCIESYENAISFGRLDQLLYPYYTRDLEAGRITYEKARELLCLFVLKMDEDILVNDGNTFPQLFNLFETLSTDQGIIFGGVDKDGKDATNDITYMLVDACELQPLAADLGARIHKDSPDEYLERLAQVYINGCPMPKLFSDERYIEALLKHYPITVEQARNYGIVGCVEPNATEDHFGNTDCANVNVTLPLLQAIKGQEHDLWNEEFRDQLTTLSLNLIKYACDGKGRLAQAATRACDTLLAGRDARRGRRVCNPPSGMGELLERYQARLNRLTQSILADHQKMEAELRKNFTTPLASSLFQGCLESGKDIYEGGTTFNSSGIQAVGVTDAADSLHAIDEVVYKRRLHTINDIIDAIDHNFEGERRQKIRGALLAVPKFGDDSSKTAVEWVNKVLQMYNNALDSVQNCPRGGRYSAGYYALNVGTRYGRNTPALPSGRPAGVSLANGIMPHYGMQQKDLMSALNAIAAVDFVEHAENGTTATLTIDAALFQNAEGRKNLAGLFKTFLLNGGMQLQPNIVDRRMLLDAYDHPEKYPDLMVRIAGYCAYFNELSDEMKQVVINRTYYT